MAAYAGGDAAEMEYYGDEGRLSEQLQFEMLGISKS